MDKAPHQTLGPDEIGELVRTAFGGDPGESRPCAFFDAPLDCIRVLERDCSVTEWRLSPRLTVLEDNYFSPTAGRNRYVGFTIKGARHFCQQRGIDLNTPIEWGEMLDALLAVSTEPEVRIIIDTFARPLVTAKQIPPVRLPLAA